MVHLARDQLLQPPHQPPHRPAPQAGRKGAPSKNRHVEAMRRAPLGTWSETQSSRRLLQSYKQSFSGPSCSVQHQAGFVVGSWKSALHGPGLILAKIRSKSRASKRAQRAQMQT